METPKAAAPSIDDRRAAQRLTMLQAAQIAWATGAPVKCMVRDLSHTGAKIEVRSPVPDTFDLVFGDQSRRSCTVVWRKETQLGVKFSH
jgi:PilZ domain